VPGGDQLLGEQACAAAQLQDKALTGAHLFEQVEDPWSAHLSVEREATMVDEGQVTTVVWSGVAGHSSMLACCGFAVSDSRRTGEKALDLGVPIGTTR
jgi:hypothetical protein